MDAPRLRIGKFGMTIMLAVVLPVLAISVIISVATTWNMSSSLVEVAEENLMNNAAIAVAGLETELELIEGVYGVASLLVAQGASRKDIRPGSEDEMRIYQEISKQIFLQGDHEPGELLSLHLSFLPDENGLIRQLRYEPESSGEELSIREIILTKATVAVAPGYDYLRHPMDTGEPYWSDVYTNNAVGRRVLTFSRPVMTPEGMIGVLGVDYGPERFRQVLLRYDYGDSGYAFVFSRTERIIFHPALEFGLLLDDFADPDEETLISHLRSGEPEGVFSYRYAGEDKYMGYRRLHNGWFLGVTVEDPEVRIPVRSNLRTIGFVSTAWIIVSLVIALLLTRAIISPLNQTYSEISRVIGHPENTLDLSRVSSRKDEIGTVARAFEELTELNHETMERLVDENLEKERLASMGDKLPDISHEVEGKLGTIVTGASFVMDSLPDDEDSETKRKGLALVLDAADQAKRIMRSVKNTSAAQMNHGVSRFNLKNLIEDVEISLHHIAKKKTIDFRLDIPETLFLNTESGSLVQVFDNLISNSLRHGFTSADTGTIQISSRVDGGKLVIDYRDDGSGIPEQGGERIFERFYTTAGESGGTGIGMYLVKTLMERELGGHVQYLPGADPGVHFRLTLDQALIDG